MITNKEWQAIKENDASFDTIFRYAVKTTNIYCRPSCPSRLPKKENVEIFHDLNAPEKEGYQPCKRCCPNNEKVDSLIWTEEIEGILQRHYASNLTLKELAFLAHGSESSLRHTFKKVTNQTPQQRLLTIRMTHAKEKLLQTTKTVEQIGTEVGLNNVSFFIRTFKAYYGESPKQYRVKNE